MAGEDVGRKWPEAGFGTFRRKKQQAAGGRRRRGLFTPRLRPRRARTFVAPPLRVSFVEVSRPVPGDDLRLVALSSDPPSLSLLFCSRARLDVTLGGPSRARARAQARATLPYSGEKREKSESPSPWFAAYFGGSAHRFTQQLRQGSEAKESSKFAARRRQQRALYTERKVKEVSSHTAARRRDLEKTSSKSDNETKVSETSKDSACVMGNTGSAGEKDLGRAVTRAGKETAVC